MQKNNTQRTFQKKYHHLQQKIERAIKNGRFYRYTKRKQQQLLKRLARYQKRLLRAGQLAVPVVGLLVTSTTSSQAQNFSIVTDSASPFINAAVGDANAPFGLSDVGYNSSPSFVDIDGDGDLDAFVGNYNGIISYYENTDPTTDKSNP
ncbi:MAG: VCBS repeat-containing protein, partial [Bacteroidota bacterium]